MKLTKTLILAFILPFVVALNACQEQSDKNTTSQEQSFYNSKTDAPTGTDDLESAPKNKDFKSGENKPDGLLKQVSYQQPTENTNPTDKRMIIRTGTMSIENDSFDETELKAKEIAKNLGGFITNSTAQVNQSGKKQGTLTIRVQADKYDALLAELAKTGKVMNQNITGRDVTEEYVDAEARLKTQRELETRLLQLLAEKTANLTAVVEVEQKLANVRENIERTEGRMRMLKDQASFSTITLSIYEPAILNTSSGGFFYELERGFEKGLTGFTKVLAGIITFVIAMAPILAILGFIVYIVIRVVKKRKVVKA
ncbi:MAG TPA: DUF4349 domain-containing protein [Ignavibacteria bacterium]|nr:DUF4349 domain-containing protein [Ignavibacteria bacterium]HMQ98454.1 DUF4349 domain-containing protein [Ignavibacteria bacterium]